MTQYLINSMSLCHPPRIRLASATHPHRCCAALILFVHSHTVRMMPPWLVEHPPAGSVRLVPVCFNLVFYE